MSVLFYQGIVSIFREDTFIELRESFEIVGPEIKRDRAFHVAEIKRDKSFHVAETTRYRGVSQVRNVGERE